MYPLIDVTVQQSQGAGGQRRQSGNQVEDVRFPSDAGTYIRERPPITTDAQRASASGRAQVINFESQLGLGTLVGPGAANQKQRCATARALLKRAHGIKYNEAALALDGENEQAVMYGAFNAADQSLTDPRFTWERAATQNATVSRSASGNTPGAGGKMSGQGT